MSGTNNWRAVFIAGLDARANIAIREEGMKPIFAILIALVICGTAAALEGVCAGKSVRSFFATLRFPRYSAPLWVWTIIGVIYYLIFFFIIYRLFRFSSYPFWWYVALGLCVFMMVVNGLSNYVIFRARNLYLSFVIGAVFPVMDVTLFVLLMALDRSAALAMIPYLLYATAPPAQLLSAKKKAPAECYCLGWRGSFSGVVML
jgi:tryptophan-rich sensory protein